MKGSVFRSCAFILHPSSLILEELAVAEGFEPSVAGLTIRCLTNLATPQEIVSSFGFQVSSFKFQVSGCASNLNHETRNLKLETRNLKLETRNLKLEELETSTGCGDESRTRVISFTRRALC